MQRLRVTHGLEYGAACRACVHAVSLAQHWGAPARVSSTVLLLLWPTRACRGGRLHSGTQRAWRAASLQLKRLSFISFRSRSEVHPSAQVADAAAVGAHFGPAQAGHGAAGAGRRDVLRAPAERHGQGRRSGERHNPATQNKEVIRLNAVRPRPTLTCLPPLVSCKHTPLRRTLPQALARHGNRPRL